MTRRSALLGVAFVASVLLGCLVGGAVVFFRAVAPTAEMLALANLSREGNEAYVKYRYGTYSVAKTALLKYADEAKVLHGARRTVGLDAAAFDLGLTYGRLALAAERTGHEEEAAEYMHLAREAFRGRGYAADETQVREAVERLDRAWDQRLGAQTK